MYWLEGEMNEWTGAAPADNPAADPEHNSGDAAGKYAEQEQHHLYKTLSHILESKI